jgi:hypothetical protein
LIITADAITRLETIAPQQQAEQAEADEAAAAAAATEPANHGRAYHRRPVEPPIVPEPKPTASRGPTMAYSVLLLSIWLGVASLGSASATATLRMTSFLAAILIFYRGWQVIVPKGP